MRTLAIVLTLLALGVQTRAASILPYNPGSLPPYCLNMTADEPISFEIRLFPEGAADIVGARFRISGLPAGCGVAVVPSSVASSYLGDVFSSAGAEIVFATAQTGVSVKLLDVTLTCPASSMSQYITLRPDAALPTAPGLECPLVIRTGGPELVYGCAWYMSISNHPLWCEIGVTPTTWGASKVLFR